MTAGPRGEAAHRVEVRRGDGGNPSGPVPPGASLVPLPWRKLGDHQCFGCSHENPWGLALEFYETGKGLVCPLRFTRVHESYPGVIHGGIVATVLDELMGNLLALTRGVITFTVTLRVRFVAPILVGHSYRAEGRIFREGGEQFEVHGDIVDEQGGTHATATGKYKSVTVDQCETLMCVEPADRELFSRYLARS